MLKRKCYRNACTMLNQLHHLQVLPSQSKITNFFVGKDQGQERAKKSKQSSIKIKIKNNIIKFGEPCKKADDGWIRRKHRANRSEMSSLRNTLPYYTHSHVCFCLNLFSVYGSRFKPGSWHFSFLGLEEVLWI